jgi:hypothetical protein
MIRLATLHVNGVEAGKPNFALGPGPTRSLRSSEATGGSTRQEVKKFVALLSKVRRALTAREVFTDEVIKQGKVAELEKLKKNFIPRTPPL